LKLFQESLLAKLVGYFFLLSSVIVVLLGVSSYYFFVKDIKKAIFDQLGSVASVKEDVLNRWIKRQKLDITTLSQSETLREQARILFTTEGSSPEYTATYTYLIKWFGWILENNNGISDFFILTKKGGEVILSTDKSREGYFHVMDTFFIEGKKAVFVQNIYPSPVTLKPAITVSTPLYGKDKTLIGVLAADLNLVSMDSIIHEHTGLGEAGETYLVDRFNLFVSGERFGSEEFPRGVHSTGIDTAITGVDGSGLYMNYRGKPVIGVYRWIEELDLALIAEIQKSEAFKSARYRIVIVLIIGLILVILLAVGVYILAIRIAKPVQAVKDAALKVANGDLESKAPVSSRDEIGVLAETFNQMTDRLKGVYDELKQSEERYRSFFEEDLTGDYIATPDGKIHSCNQAFVRIFGFASIEEVKKHNLHSFYPDAQGFDSFIIQLREKK
jgi:HAMP domain-containing protein